jgi:hypothetical protein
MESVAGSDSEEDSDDSDEEWEEEEDSSSEEEPPPPPPKRARRRQAQVSAQPDLPDHMRRILDMVSIKHLTPCFLVSKAWQAYVKLRYPQLAKISKLNTYQKRTLGYLGVYRLKNIVAAVDRECVVCGKSWMGAIHDVFGVPAHHRCVRDRLVNVRHVKFENKHVGAYVLPRIPQCALGGYNRGAFTYDAVWLKMHDAVPPSSTVEGYVVEHAALIVEHVEAAKEQERIAKEARAQEAKEARERAKAQRAAIKEEWTRVFKEAAKATRAPFKTPVGMKRSLPAGIKSFGCFGEGTPPQRVVALGAFVCAHADEVPDDDDGTIWKWILGGGDGGNSSDANMESRLQTACSCAPDIPVLIRPYAFSVKVVDPTVFGGGDVSEPFVAAACKILAREDKYYSVAQVYANLRQHMSTVVTFVDVLASNTLTRYDWLNTTLTTLHGLPSLSIPHIIRCGSVSQVSRSFDTAKAVAGANAFERYGDRCFSIPHNSSDARALAHLNTPLPPLPPVHNSGTCHCGNKSAGACPHTMCGKCCVGPCARHHK